jgi:hypothetical protein
MLWDDYPVPCEPALPLPCTKTTKYRNAWTLVPGLRKLNSALRTTSTFTHPTPNHQSIT